MWASRILRYRVISVFKRTYLTNQFKTTMELRLEAPQIDRHTKKMFGQSDDLLPFELETFISSIPPNEDRRDELHEKLIKLRSSKNTSLMSGTLNHAVINYLMSVDVNDLLLILSNRLRYGVFVDTFTGCYLMNMLLEKKDYSGAVQIAAELLLQEDDDELVQALSLISAFNYVNNNLSHSEPAQSTTEAEKKTDKPVKVRVKFLRNPVENKLINTSVVNFELIANILTNISKNCTEKFIKENGKLLASIVKNDLNGLKLLLSGDTSALCKDISEIGLTILKDDKENQELEYIKKCLEKVKDTSNLNYSDVLNKFVKDSVAKREVALIDERKVLYEKWLADRKNKLDNAIESQSKFLRQAEIEETLANISKKRQQLWFFETQDKLDMEIFRKQVRYPKRWFGKKKKPRAVDDNYVPPEIRSK